MAEPTVLENLESNVLTLTLNRPEKLNAWNEAMYNQFEDAMLRAGTNPDVRVIVITGAGRGFCAGVDLESVSSFSQADGGEPSDFGSKLPWGEDLPRFMRSKFAGPALVPKPVIAAINGPVVAVGLTIPLYSDIRIASSKAQFIAAFSRLGLVAERGVDLLLAQTIGTAHATEMLLSGRRVGAQEALRIGLVSAVHDEDVFHAEVQAYAREIAESCSPRSLSVIKRQLQHGRFESSEETLERGERELSLSLKVPDLREGLAAMSQKRKPRFPELQV